jgi:hypothetical protein
MSMLVDLCDQYMLILDVSRIFLNVTIIFVTDYDLQAEEQLVPIFHDSGMRQQVSIWSNILLLLLMCLFIYSLSAGTILLCIYCSKRDAPFKGAVCPEEPSESTASSNNSIFNIPSPQSTKFHSGKTV